MNTRSLKYFMKVVEAHYTKSFTQVYTVCWERKENRLNSGAPCLCDESVGLRRDEKARLYNYDSCTCGGDDVFVWPSSPSSSSSSLLSSLSSLVHYKQQISSSVLHLLVWGVCAPSGSGKGSSFRLHSQLCLPWFYNFWPSMCTKYIYRCFMSF